MSRTIRVKDTDRNGILTIESNATTFGQLRDQLSSDNGVSFNNKRVIVRETRVTLDSLEAQLPEGSFTIYLMPEKSKAGADYSNLTFHQLRSFCSSLGLPANGVSREQMETSLEQHYGTTTQDEVNPDIARAVSLIEEALDILRGAEGFSSEDQSIIDDFNALRQELGL